MFTLIDSDTDDELSTFATLQEALRAARKLAAYEIINEATGQRVAFADRHPDDDIPPDDTPALDPPWWITER